MTNQDVEVVTKQFEAQLAHYTSEKRGARNSRIVSFLAAAHQTDPFLASRASLSICEFGGADGLPLAAVREQMASRRIRLVNAELVEMFASRQADPAIGFATTSILEPEFPDASFDIVIARHVLHHLVAGSLRETRTNQARAFAQLARVTRPGGLVLLEEHVNPSAFSCWSPFQLSPLASRLKLSLPAFEVTPYTVVAFLTPDLLVELAAKGSGGTLEAITREFLPMPLPIQWRLTMLRRESGNLFVAFRVARTA